MAQRLTVIYLERPPLCSTSGRAQFHTLGANHSSIYLPGGSIVQKPIIHTSTFLSLMYTLMLLTFHPVISLLLRHLPCHPYQNHLLENRSQRLYCRRKLTN